MISNPTNLIAPDAAPRRERLKASADCWLSLAAAPTFATMALLTATLGSGAPDLLCSAMHHASSLGGMVPMYLLMSALHLSPWLKLVSRQRGVLRRS